MITMRLMRVGAKNRPFYRIVVIDSRKPRESKTTDYIGFYNPLKEPPEININLEKARFWLKRGAQTSRTVQSLIHKVSKSNELSNLQDSKT
ncbi:MAG: 30S ribosomal protein S16 [Candidatus Aminicenantales bacterium]